VTLGKVATGAVDSAAVVNDSLTSDDLGPLSVNTSELGNLQVTTGKIADQAVGSLQIADSSITGNDIAPNALGAGSLGSLSVGNDELANDAVDTGELVDQAVTTAKIRDDAVNNAKIADNAVEGAQIRDGYLRADDIAGLGGGGPLAGQMALDPNSLTAGACQTIDYGLNGVDVGAYLIVNPMGALPAGITMQPLTGTTNNMHVQFCNVSGGTVDPTLAVYSYLVINP
jgi:hypothetical protein